VVVSNEPKCPQLVQNDLAGFGGDVRGTDGKGPEVITYHRAYRDYSCNNYLRKIVPVRFRGDGNTAGRRMYDEEVYKYAVERKEKKICYRLRKL